MAVKLTYKEIKYFLRSSPRKISEKAFSFSLILIIFSVMIGGIVFYRYDIDIAKGGAETEKPPATFNESLYKKVLENQAAREKRLGEINSATSSNPFAF